MTTDRKFAAFSRDGREGMGVSEIPKDGFCISAFLVIREIDNPTHILMGRLNPQENWAHIGALTKDRLEEHSKGWILPSCHLLYGESPDDAAKRIATEQLGLTPAELHLSEPRAFSEVYASKRMPDRKEHWDLEFIVKGEIDRKKITEKKLSVWKDLDFIDMSKGSRNDIARSHEDIIARVL